MNTNTPIRYIVAVSLLFAGGAAIAQNTPSAKPGAPPKLATGYGKLPLSFEPNRGQSAKEVQWLARGPQYTLYLAGSDAVLQMNKIKPARRSSANPKDLQPSISSSSAVRMSLLGAGAPKQTNGEDLQSGKANYFTGNDPAKWQRDVPMYGKVRMQGVYPGVDLVYYGHQGALEYDFVVAPGANASTIQLRFDGAKPALASNGDLVLPVEGGPEVRFNKPVVFQMADGVRQHVDGSFVIASVNRQQQVSFRLGAYDRSRELVIDPTLLFAGALGTGNYETEANGLAVNKEGEIILTGLTGDVNFPVTKGAFDTECNEASKLFTANGYVRCGSEIYNGSAFVTKISADGKSLVYSTYLHGLSGYESGTAVAVDASGDAIVFGSTSSMDFPVTSDAYQSLCAPYYQPKGVAGGDPSDFYPVAEHCDGYNSSNEWGVGGPTLFIAKLNPSGSSLLYATFFGGTNPTYPTSLALDSSDNMYFTSYLQNAEQYLQNGVLVNNWYPQNGTVPFPYTAGAFQPANLANQVATLSVLSADGHSLLYSTTFGATDSEPGLNWVQPLAVAAGPNGRAYVGGYTGSDAVPTTKDAVRPSCVDSMKYSGSESGNCEGYTGWLAAFDTTQSGSASLAYATYIGGPEVPAGNSAQNQVLGLTADEDNNLFVTGLTTSPKYPTTPGVFSSTCTNFSTGNGTCNDTAFVTKIDPTGSKYLWSTYFGGTNLSQSQGQAISLDAKGQVYLYGYDNNYTFDIPLKNALEGRPGNGSSYAFVATFSSDGKDLIFSTPLGNSNPNAGNLFPVPNNGMALDAEGNIYFALYGSDSGTFPTTKGTYATTAVGGGNRSFFGKISRVLPEVATPVFSPAGGTYASIQTVTLTSATPGATIYYAMHGVTPTTSSTKYTGPITVSATETVAAIAVASDYTNSAEATAKYIINLPVTDRPVISPAAGTYPTPKTIVITDATKGAAIYYTTNGATPTTASTKYTAAFKLPESATVKAIALAADHLQSSVASSAYIIETPTARPVISPAAGTYATAKTVTISDATAGAAIFYTINGTTPTATSTKYAAAFKVSATATVKAIAIAPVHTPSSVASSKFTIETPAAKPVFSVAAGTYKSAQTVAITDATKGAIIYYTTNGKVPTASSTKYTAAIKVAATESIKAIAFAPGYDPSAEAAATYTIQ